MPVVMAMTVLTSIAVLACVNSSPPQNPASPSGITPEGWHTYTDAMHGFAISYPDAYAILPEAGLPPGGAVRRVRFQDKLLVSGELADLEPARFVIEVFALNQPLSLRAWLQSVDRLPPDAIATPLSLAGAREGIKVQRRVQLAPNEFYYFATDKHVYALTPIDSYGPSMLRSFRLLPPAA